MIVKIITSDPSLVKWGSLNRKIKAMTRALSKIKNVGNIDIRVIYQEGLVPTLRNNRITHDFMQTLTDKYTEDEQSFVLFHMSEKQKTEYGLVPTLRGVAFMDDNFYSEGYFWADENSKRNRYNQFIETSLHELRHLLKRRSGQVDDTHDKHRELGTITNSFDCIDFRQYQEGVIHKIDSWIQNTYGPTKLQPLIKRTAQDVVDEMASLGHVVHVFEGFRTKKKQDQYYSQGRTTPGNIITNAKGGQSLHNYGVAVDIVFGQQGRPSWNPKEPWKLLGKIGKKHGFFWGGDWKGFSDLPHLEMRLGFSLDDFMNGEVNYTKFQ